MITRTYGCTQMASSQDLPQLLAFGAERGMAQLRAEAAGHNVLAVLTETDADEWHRRFQRSTATAQQVALVECYDIARGATATSPDTRVISEDLVMSTVQRPVEADVLFSVLDRFLDGWEHGDAGTLLYIDSLDGLMTDMDRTAARDLFDRLLDRTRSAGSGIVAAVDPEPDAARVTVEFERRFADAVGTPNPEPQPTATVRRLREADPTKFGYFRRYWRDAIRALDTADRTYPQAKQLHDAVETEVSPRMLGAALSGLAWMDAISLRGNTNGPNRYDRSSYDPEFAARLGIAVESLDETDA